MNDEHKLNDAAPEDAAQQLAAKDEEIKELRDRMLRMRAEFDNYKKQLVREMEDVARRISDQEMLDFLPVYDALEAAFRAHQRHEDPEGFLEGVERIFAQLAAVFERKGCRPFNACGKRFDPMYHEALIAVECPEEKDTIVEEFERGWERQGRVLRPAKVKVSLGSKGGEPHGGTEGTSDRN